MKHSTTNHKGALATVWLLCGLCLVVISCGHTPRHRETNAQVTQQASLCNDSAQLNPYPPAGEEARYELIFERVALIHAQPTKKKTEHPLYPLTEKPCCKAPHANELVFRRGPKDAIGQTCTGFFVSNDELVTALHCVKKLRRTRKALTGFSRDVGADGRLDLGREVEEFRVIRCWPVWRVPAGCAGRAGELERCPDLARCRIETSKGQPSFRGTVKIAAFDDKKATYYASHMASMRAMVGQPKRVKKSRKDDRQLRLNADHAGGSSGSPVVQFDDKDAMTLVGVLSRGTSGSNGLCTCGVDCQTGTCNKDDETKNCRRFPVAAPGDRSCAPLTAWATTR